MNCASSGTWLTAKFSDAHEVPLPKLTILAADSLVPCNRIKHCNLWIFTCCDELGYIHISIENRWIIGEMRSLSFLGGPLDCILLSTCHA
jgi:hypothetical protein